MPYRDPVNQKEYLRQYHLATWDQRKVRHRLVQIGRKLSLSEWFRTYKQSLFCSKCGENDPRCLDFHHLDRAQKDVEVAQLVTEGYSIDRIMREIEKCVILCANCHRKEHGV